VAALQASPRVLLLLLCVAGFLVPLSILSPWGTVALACGAAALDSIAFAVSPTLVLELAGHARTTPTGVVAVSNQLGLFGGASLGGLLLAWGGFPQGGLCCRGALVLAVVVVHLKVRDSAALLAQMALRQGPTATE
jgi:predicted MFS family arabinose efflux permease